MLGSSGMLSTIVIVPREVRLEEAEGLESVDDVTPERAWTFSRPSETASVSSSSSRNHLSMLKSRLGGAGAGVVNSDKKLMHSLSTHRNARDLVSTEPDRECLPGRPLIKFKPHTTSLSWAGVRKVWICPVWDPPGSCFALWYPPSSLSLAKGQPLSLPEATRRHQKKIKKNE